MDNKPVAWMNSLVKWDIAVEQDITHDIPLYAHPAEPKELTVPENSQDWKGMDGATAFWLVERHSNHWGDAKLMMEEWLKANTHPAKTLTELSGVEIIGISGKYDFNYEVDIIDFVRACLRKAQEK